MLGAAEIAAAVTSGGLDPAELIEVHLRGIEELGALNAVVTACDDRAVARARSPLGKPLASVPVLVKDLLDTAGVRTTYGSRICENHVPAHTAWAVERLQRAGAVVIGKANLHEFAWGTTSQNPHFGYVGNPVFPGHVSGWLLRWERCRASGKCKRAGPGDRHRRLRQDPVGMLWDGRVPAATRSGVDVRLSGVVADARHRRPDGTNGCGLCTCVFGAQWHGHPPAAH